MQEFIHLSRAVAADLASEFRDDPQRELAAAEPTRRRQRLRPSHRPHHASPGRQIVQRACGGANRRGARRAWVPRTQPHAPLRLGERHHLGRPSPLRREVASDAQSPAPRWV